MDLELSPETSLSISSHASQYDLGSSNNSNNSNNTSNNTSRTDECESCESGSSSSSDSEQEKKQKRIKRCGTIIVKNIFGTAHVLAVRGKRSHIWSLPKGCILDNETEQQCAQRETLEETGLFLELTGMNQRICINHNVYFLVLLNQHPKFRIRDKGEVDKVNWMTLQELSDLNCNKDLRSIMQYPQRKFSFHHQLEECLQLHLLPLPALVAAAAADVTKPTETSHTATSNPTVLFEATKLLAVN